MLLALYLSTTIAAADTTGADEVRRQLPSPGQAPSVVVHRQPSVPLVALRLSILASDPPGYEGAGHLVQHLAYPALRERVGRVGGEARIERSADAIVYTVMGPSAELDHLASALIATLQPPRPAAGQLLRASQELAEERLAEWETPGLHLRAVLRGKLFPNETSAAGTSESGRRLSDPDELRTAWALIYRPERVSIVAAGAATLRGVEAAFGDLPQPFGSAAASPAADPADLEALAPAEATRGWLGLAYPADDLPPADVAVAARLARDALREELPESSVEVEHWWTHSGQALVLLVAAPRDRLADARRALGGAMRAAAGSVDARSVAAAANAVRRDMLFYSRTPDRMAEVIGRFVDRSGDGGGADRFHAEIAGADVGRVEQVFEELLDRSPVLAEVAPQPLPNR